MKYSHRFDEVLYVWEYIASTTRGGCRYSMKYLWEPGYFKSMTFGEKKTWIRRVRNLMQRAFANILEEAVLKTND